MHTAAWLWILGYFTCNWEDCKVTQPWNILILNQLPLICTVVIEIIKLGSGIHVVKCIPNMKDILCRNSTKCIFLSKKEFDCYNETVHNILTKKNIHDASKF